MWALDNTDQRGTSSPSAYYDRPANDGSTTTTHDERPANDSPAPAAHDSGARHQLSPADRRRQLLLARRILP